MSDVFKIQRYANAMYGKGHLGDHKIFQPTRHGFDEWTGILYSIDNGLLHPVLHGSDDPHVPLDQSKRLHDALIGAGVSSALYIISGVDHGGEAFHNDETKKVIRTFLNTRIAN